MFLSYAQWYIRLRWPYFYWVKYRFYFTWKSLYFTDIYVINYFFPLQKSPQRKRNQGFWAVTMKLQPLNKCINKSLNLNFWLQVGKQKCLKPCGKYKTTRFIQNMKMILFNVLKKWILTLIYMNYNKWECNAILNQHLNKLFDQRQILQTHKKYLLCYIFPFWRHFS